MGRHARVVIPARLLHGAGALHAFPDVGRGFARDDAAQLLARHGGHFHVYIDAVEHGTADLAEILLDLPGRAAAFARRVAKITTLTGIHRSHEHRAAWKAQSHIRARDRDRAVL